MAIDFPSSPTVGQSFTSGNQQWVWDGTKWVASGVASGLWVPNAGGVMTGPLTTPGISAPQAMGDNRLINGDMRIDQRNNGAAISPALGGYAVDRWQFAANQSSKVQLQRIPASSSLAEFAYCLNAQSTSTYALLASDTFWIGQVIEADMVSDFAWGTTLAQPVTLSFWARTLAMPGTFSGAIQNQPNPPTRSYPFTFSIPAINTWYFVSITIPGDVAGTWPLSGNAAGLRLLFDLGSGATYRGPANAWASAQYNGVIGANSIVTSSTANLLITGVKLEIGNIATSFNHKTIQDSLADCERYYQILDKILLSPYVVAAGMTVYGSSMFKTTMRAVPTCTVGTNSSSNATAIAFIQGTPGGVGVQGTGGGIGVAVINLVNSTLSAEL